MPYMNEKEWPHQPIDYQSFYPFHKEVDIKARLLQAGKLLGNNPNRYAEMYFTAAWEIERLREILDSNGIDYGKLLPDWHKEWGPKEEKKVESPKKEDYWYFGKE